MLRVAIVSTVGACNAHCLICPRVSDPKARMSDELFRKLIDELNEEGLETFGFGLFDEPLLDRKLLSRLQYAKAKLHDTKVVLNTNGQLLTAEMAVAIMPYVDSIVISIHALTKEIYEILMPPLKQETVLENIAWLAHNRDPSTTVHLNTIATQNNIGESRKLAERFGKFGILTHSLSCINRGGLLGEEFNRIARLPITPMDCPAEMLDDTLVVNWDGSVLLCCQDFKSEHVIGDLSTNSLNDVLQDLRRLEARKLLAEKRHSEMPMCSVCLMGTSPAGRQSYKRNT